VGLNDPYSTKIFGERPISIFEYSYLVMEGMTSSLIQSGFGAGGASGSPSPVRTGPSSQTFRWAFQPPVWVSGSDSNE
jgi:hypothetical protein